ncbi:hypothetical protein C7H19_18405 [Aphanothece hegewaldii CCALA 016]|uniref:Uncharacterized protein n=1 Tax=Aphanothece hegewaldii CCALA 016 TaxID=2107694 RepID=A0A2T1LU57_9CHRO|nr:hypothetical protein [Aphanothece hegewaldii]PSF34539.1 hypothetical protein C7H19_18405 [Aphanothece hegewaldii CCALA 016]
MTKAERDFEQDSEMLEEYDFSGGVRGKFYQAYQNNNLQPLPGVQFVVNKHGIKTGVLIYLSEHHNLLNNVLAQFDSTDEFQYVINQNGHQIALLLNLEKYLSLWQQIYDYLDQERQELEKSAELYAEIYAEDQDLQELTESALIDEIR